MLALGLASPPAHAAGPGVTLFVNTIPRPIDLPGTRFAGGMSIRSLVAQAGVDPASVTFVNVTRDDAGQIALTRAQLSAARIIDNGTTTRFVHGATTITATADTGPLQVSINGGDMTVVASVSRSRIEANESVSFSARVRFAPPGAQLTFEWDFNDGSPRKRGRNVTHVYKFGGDYAARVTVTGTSGSTGRCATSCIGHDDVEVSVGEPPPEPPAAPPGPGGGAGTGPGSGAGTGTGMGGTGGGAGTGAGGDPGATDPATAAEPEPKPEPKPKPKPKKPFGVTISGVLISGPGTTIDKLPTGSAAGAPSGRRPTRRADGDAPIDLPLAALAALAVFSLGALRERRGVRLRVA